MMMLLVVLHTEELGGSKKTFHPVHIRERYTRGSIIWGRGLTQLTLFWRAAVSWWRSQTGRSTIGSSMAEGLTEMEIVILVSVPCFVLKVTLPPLLSLCFLYIWLKRFREEWIYNQYSIYITLPPCISYHILWYNIEGGNTLCTAFVTIISPDGAELGSPGSAVICSKVPTQVVGYQGLQFWAQPTP